MNRITDTIITTQICVVIAAIAIMCADRIDLGIWLNDNWYFMVFILLIIAGVFMALPHWLCNPYRDSYRNKSYPFITPSDLDIRRAAEDGQFYTSRGDQS